MKCRTMKKMMKKCQWILLALFTICACSCKDDDSSADTSVFDPSKPVVISDFIPKEGGTGQRLVIYGENFGSDKSLINVMIGGKKSTVINVNNNSIYCLVPSQAYTGDIKVTIGNDENQVTGIAESTFEYKKKMVVGTLCGYRNEYDNQGWKDGPFETCCGFRNDGCLKFDPLYPDHLYVIYDGADIQLLDLKNRMLSTPINRSSFGDRRLRSLDFTKDGQYMVISVDFNGWGTGTSPSVYFMKRNENGSFTNNSSIQLVASYKECNGAALHPINNNELYFNSYERGQVFRMDVSKYFETINNGGTWNPDRDGGNYEELFTIQDTGWEFQINIHPSGNYAYIVVINQHYILRTDYNWEKKRFAPAYVVAGQARSAGWEDAAGVKARLDRPYQGVFVKNPEYETEGRDDVYDFYFCDNKTHSIRKLSPEGIVSTYAGRGNTTSVVDNNVWGTEDGDLREVARFRDPCGIAYDERNNVFYILDVVGRKIRTISMEGETSIDLENNTESDESN